MNVREKLVDIVERASVRTLPKNTCHTNIVMLVNALIEEGVTVQECARPLEEWGEDYGDVLWWKFPIEEPPYVGSPLDEKWPAYHTHWAPIILPPTAERRLIMADNDLISRQALLKDGLLFQNGIDEGGLLYVPLRDVTRSIRNAKKMGSIKVTHGKWVSNGIPESILSACSVCGFPCGASTFNYCPQCGAMMDL